MHMMHKHLWRQNTNAYKISKYFGLFVLGFSKKQEGHRGVYSKWKEICWEGREGGVE